MNIHTHLFKLPVLLLALCFSAVAHAQQFIDVSGRVLDSRSREPLTGATIKEQGATNGTTTGIDGRFVLQTTPGATLVVSYVGYDEQRITAEADRELIVRLDEKATMLEEAVVIGYGVQRKSDITGAISSVAGKDINNVPVGSALQALQGKAAGVNIIQNTGSPGGSTTIQIRGVGTVNDAAPLYVVDGFILDDIAHLNPTDIAHIEILKDAASGAVYGARGANGVVLITTKNGEKGKTKISVDYFAGISNPWKKIPVMSTADYALMLDYIHGLSDFSAEGKLYHSKDPISGALYYDSRKFQRVDTIRNNSPANWWDAITRTGFKQQVNVTATGGNDKNRYLLSGGLYSEHGIVKTASYRRFNTRINVNSQITPWLGINANALYTSEARHIVPEGQNSILKTALFQSPMTYTYNSRGYYTENHPIAILNRNHNDMGRHRIDLNLSLTANLTKWLTYGFKASDYLVIDNRANFIEVHKLNEDFDPNDLTTAYRYRRLNNKWEVNNLFTITRSNNLHNLTVLAGQTAEAYNADFVDATRKGTAGNYPHLRYLSAAYTGDKTDGLNDQWAALGFIGRINYNLMERYLIQLNFRADASSIFAKTARWGYFPSVSVGWKFTSEPFMNPIKWISLGKIRAGWGQLGNNRIEEASRHTLLRTGYNYPYGVGNHILSPGITATTIGNPNIHWEKTETLNIGIDLGFWKNQLTLGIEYFNRITTDMLLRVPVTLSAGLDDAPMTNAGAVINRGLETSIGFKGGSGKLKYEIAINATYLQNRVVSLGTGNEPIYGGYLNEASILGFVTKTEVGRPIASFYGYVTDGIFNSYDEVKNSAQYDYGKNDFEQTTRPGDFRFKDINDDGLITAEDRTFLGSPLPDIVFGLPITIGYAPIECRLVIQGQMGNKIFNVMEYYLNNAAEGNLYANIRSKHWAGQMPNREFFPSNLNGNIPDLDPSDAARNFRSSDFMLKDGSYARLKEVRLDYHFDPKICAALGLAELSIFANAYNLITLTSYNGFDPEVGKVFGTEGNNLNIGVDHGNYPQARTFTCGFKLTL